VSEREKTVDAGQRTAERPTQQPEQAVSVPVRSGGSANDSGEPRLKVVDRRWWAQPAGATADEAATELRKPSYVEELERQLAEKDEVVRETIAKYRSASEEFEAARVRFRREVAKEVERGKRIILLELLDVVDNLDRAIDSVQSEESITEASESLQHSRVRLLLQGVEMVRNQFLARLDGFGVKRLEVVGHRFDPERHEAVATVPASEPGQDGVVAGIVRHGYAIGDDILRPALVAVTKAD
jgi:molecular chaperone GrpE